MVPFNKDIRSLATSDVFCQLFFVSKIPFWDGSYSSNPSYVWLAGMPASSTRAVTLSNAFWLGSSTAK